MPFHICLKQAMGTMRHEKDEMGFEHARMFSACSHVNPDLQHVPNSQTTGTTEGLHWLHRLCSPQYTCPNHIQSFMKSESVQSRKCYTTVSTINSFLPTLTLCSNMLHLSLNLGYFSYGKRLLRFQPSWDFGMPSIPGLCHSCST